MELLLGQTLDALLLERVRISESMAISLAIEAVEGLSAASEMGFVHGDLRPENMFIDKRHGMKLLGFGMSKVEASHAAQTNLIWGSPNHIPPERILKRPENHRSDIYSLGAVIFHAIAGRPPFVSKDPADVFKKKLSENATELHNIIPGVHLRTSEIITRMIHPDISHRYPDYQSLLEDFYSLREQLVSNGRDAAPIAADVKRKTARQSSPPERIGSENQRKVATTEVRQAPEKNKRRKSPSKLLGLSVLLLVAAVIGGWYFHSGSSKYADFFVNFEPEPREKISKRAFEGKTCLIDSGDLFGLKANGFVYGWSKKAEYARIRGSANSKNYLYDSKIEMPKGPDVFWEIEVPNGFYSVQTVLGDPDYFATHAFGVLVEGKLVSGIPHSSRRWVERTVNVQVNDGKLSISNADSSDHNDLSFLRIRKIPETRLTEDPEPIIVNSSKPVKGSAPFSITINGEIAETSRKVTKVAFFDFNGQIGEASNLPCTLKITDLKIGIHYLRMEVTDEHGDTFISSPLKVTVQSPFEGKLAKPMKINFQPADNFISYYYQLRVETDPLPEGYFIDNGQAFDKTDSGLRYGWSTQLKDFFFVSNYTPTLACLDMRYATAISFNHPKSESGPVYWQLELPNGKYRVRVVAGIFLRGDGNNSNNKLDQQIFIEDKLVLNGTTQLGEYWLEDLVEIEVKDGFLTLSSKNAESCISFLEIEALQDQ